MDPVSKPLFVLERACGSASQLQKQCSHSGETEAEAAIAVGVDSAQQSGSVHCLTDICFILHKLQMGLGVSGTVIKLHITTKAAVCLGSLTVT